MAVRDADRREELTGFAFDVAPALDLIVQRHLERGGLCGTQVGRDQDAATRGGGAW